MNKNKINYLICVNENRNIWVHSRYDTLMQCQSSHKYFEIIHKTFIFQLKLPSFLDQTLNLSVLPPIFSRNGFYNFCFQNPSENSESDQLHCHYMFVDDLSLLKRRLSHDAVQFLKWIIHFQVFRPHIFSWGLLFPCCRFIFLPLAFACCTPIVR